MGFDSFAASVSSLLAITVDRYLSLYNALTYYSRRTVGRAPPSCCHLDRVLRLGLLPVLGWNCLAERAACSVVRPLTRSHAALLSATFFAVFSIMLHLYVRICQVVRGTHTRSRCSSTAWRHPTLLPPEKVERWQWCWALSLRQLAALCHLLRGR